MGTEPASVTSGLLQRRQGGGLGSAPLPYTAIVTGKLVVHARTQDA